MGFLDVSPGEIDFGNIIVGQAYTQRVTLTNPHDSAVDVHIKCSASQRYQLRPQRLTLDAGESASISIRLKVERFQPRRKRIQKDSFHLKGEFFEQMFFAKFCVAADGQGTTVRHGSSGAIVNFFLLNRSAMSITSLNVKFQEILNSFHDK